MVKDGQEMTSMFLDGNRTRIFSFSRDALTQLSYQFDNRSTAAHPKVLAHGQDDGQEARWVVNRLSGCTGFEPDCGTRPLLPITQTQRPSKLARPMGIEPTSPGLNPGVLSRLNYGTFREPGQTRAQIADAVMLPFQAESDGQVA
jgi:hypothetical protein